MLVTGEVWMRKEKKKNKVERLHSLSKMVEGTNTRKKGLRKTNKKKI